MTSIKYTLFVFATILTIIACKKEEPPREVAVFDDTPFVLEHARF